MFHTVKLLWCYCKRVGKRDSTRARVREHVTSLAMSVYFCFSLGSRTAHQSARILVAPRLSKRGCSCRTRERWRLQKRRKAFIGRRARCSLESSSTSSVLLPHCTCDPCCWPHSTGCWDTITTNQMQCCPLFSVSFVWETDVSPEFED